MRRKVKCMSSEFAVTEKGQAKLSIFLGAKILPHNDLKEKSRKKQTEVKIEGSAEDSNESGYFEAEIHIKRRDGALSLLYSSN